LNFSQPLDFVDTVVTNIFSVAKQAGSTAKAIFNTLQAYEEVKTINLFNKIFDFDLILADSTCSKSTNNIG
jgi:hypothetical protein